MKDRKLKIIDTLQPYVNGKLITNVFVNYWDELVELIKRDLNEV